MTPSQWILRKLKGNSRPFFRDPALSSSNHLRLRDLPGGVGSNEVPNQARGTKEDRWNDERSGEKTEASRQPWRVQARHAQFLPLFRHPLSEAQVAPAPEIDGYYNR